MANGVAKNGSITYRDVYELVDKRTNEIDSKIQHMSDRFDRLEAGRLSSVEQEIAKLKGQIIVWGAVVGIIITIATVFLDNWLK